MCVCVCVCMCAYVNIDMYWYMGCTCCGVPTKWNTSAILKSEAVVSARRGFIFRSETWWHATSDKNNNLNHRAVLYLGCDLLAEAFGRAARLWDERVHFSTRHLMHTRSRRLSSRHTPNRKPQTLEIHTPVARGRSTKPFWWYKWIQISRLWINNCLSQWTRATDWTSRAVGSWDFFQAFIWVFEVRGFISQNVFIIQFQKVNSPTISSSYSKLTSLYHR